MVSVIITTHNRCNLLERAIQSVLNQIYKDFELIVVADGCTDGTDSLMKKYESEKRIQYIHYSPAKEVITHEIKVYKILVVNLLHFLMMMTSGCLKNWNYKLQKLEKILNVYLFIRGFVLCT